MNISALTAAAVSAALLALSPAQAAKLDLSKGADALSAMRKIQCSTRDGEPVVYQWTGRVYSRVQGEPDRHIFNVEGMNVRQCGSVNDPARGPGYRMVSKEIMLYLDPKTNAVLRTWSNPWTGKDVEVIHVANDPVNSRPSYANGADGKPYTLNARISDGWVFMPIEVPLFYTNPLAGDYQPYVGNQYHAMEIFDFLASEKDLLDGSKPRAKAAVAWVRIAEWLPWMEMGDRPGLMVVNATGQTVSGIDALPKVMRDEIAANYPDYRNPPPLDDARPNETSWTYFKKVLDARKAAKPAQ